MSLVLVNPSLSAGGTERVVSTLANHWAARGEIVTILTLDSTQNDCYALDSRVSRIGLGMVADSGTFLGAVASNYRRVTALRAAIKETRATAIISFQDHMNVLSILATIGLRLRRVISERTDPTKKRIGRAWSILRRLLYPLADALVVQTEAFHGWARAVMLRPRRVEVIPNPVREMGAYIRVPEDRAGGVIVAVGRLYGVKQFDMLIAAFARIAGEFPEWSLTIVGEGPERARLSAMATALQVEQRVTLTGWLEEPGVVLKTASLFVMSSRYEGFPNALIEAMACGVPVITTDWSGASEIVSDGLNGLLITNGSDAELAAAMRALIADGDRRSLLGAAARDTVSERYKLGTIIDRWDTVLARPCQTHSTLKSCS